MAENPQSSTRTHEIELELDATPEEVFSAITEADILTDVMHIEDVLAEMGHKMERGAALAAAAKAF